jgi:S-DNA-T family DNA segregation ATPase FtsK/SpoIIIE
VTGLELIGRAAASYLAARIRQTDPSEGTARFLLDRLKGPIVAGICREILGRPELAPQVRIRVPRELGGPHGLPADVLTDERATHWRNVDCDRPILLLANVDDDQGQSLRDIAPVGSDQLREEPRLWVEEAGAGLPLTPSHLAIWEKSLKGLLDSRAVSLEALASYVLLTRRGVEVEGLPLVRALGWALPAIGLPRDSAYFNAIPEKTLTHANRWKRLYQQAFQKRACYLRKETPAQQPISNEQLLETWSRVKEDVPVAFHPLVEAFIAAPARWTSEAESLAQLEWERDNIRALFDELRARPEPLGQTTLNFYEDTLPDALSDEEKDYLKRLDERRTRDPQDDDEEFFERHRAELAGERRLKARWDKFIFGKAIETDDFAVGLLRCVERLFGQAGSDSNSRLLKIESTRHAPRDWLDMNYEAAAYFSRRYRGLRNLLGTAVEWTVGHIFSLERLVAERQARGTYERTQSISRTKNEIKFYVTLECSTDAGVLGYSTQMIWRFNPGGICSAFAEDWGRVANHPLALCRVSREPVSKKGRLQGIDLDDVTTLMPVFRQDRGSLVGTYAPEQDLQSVIGESLRRGLADNRLTPEGHAALKLAWERFAEVYEHSVTEFYSDGLSSSACLDLEAAYAGLLEALHRHAPGDGNRKQIWEPIINLGVASVEGGPPAAIVTPWHPLTLLGIVAKARQVCGLIRHLLTARTVDFGDARLFFSDLAEELTHPYYPDVCLGFEGREPVLLSRTDTCGDYALAEPPVAKQADEATNENPSAAAQEVVSLVERYLSLQPHEQANLSVVLYDCNSARLPEATVNALGSLYEEDEEVRCQIILRHHRPERLHDLYEKLLEGSDVDADSLVASEASRDFMARLRISIMAAAAPLDSPAEGPRYDIVFLQDVIARLADLAWLNVPSSGSIPELWNHVPPRHSRRRPATSDELRSVVYLTCPIQPLVGWRYLQTVHAFLHSTESDLQTRPLPARQISFEHNVTRQIFDEVHRLGQWVVNSDDLLTRRQLKNQGVQIIRYQRHRHDERSLTISSRAPLNLLHVMVQRRLGGLNLSLGDEALMDLTRRMVSDATDISGDIVLRAAKRGEAAGELIGLVLSRFLIEDELAGARHRGWYFLDDYAAWLGQKEGHLADMLALSPRREGEHIVLWALVGESKYVARAALAQAKQSSAVQLRETLTRLDEALFGDPGRLDRDLWLSRLADLILDGIEVPPTDGMVLYDWRDAIREGRARILVKGYSHVFVHEGEDNPSERQVVPRVRGAWQEVYGRAALRNVVLAYHQRQSPRKIRESLGDDRPWDDHNPAVVADRVEWAAVPRPRPEPPSAPPAPTSQSPPVSSPPAPPAPVSPPAASASAAPERAAPPPAAPAAPEAAEGFDWATPVVRKILRDLEAMSSPSGDADEGWLRETVARLKGALLGYDLQARVLGERLTPNAALVRLQGSDRLRVSDVERKRDEILTTHGLQITNILAEPGQVVISVARPHRQVVSLADVWRTRRVDASGANQSLVVGIRESNGETLYLRPGEENAPHTLVAGTTGSGKSVLLQNLLLDIAATNDPGSARIVLIDPKQGADYLSLQELPHLEGGILVTQGQARSALEHAVVEMQRRYELFRKKRVSKLSLYNAAIGSEERLPVLWIVHDEFAVWMLTDEYKETVSSTVQQLGVMARAAGIFLIFAAQRPEDRVMPLQLRDNLGNRLVLRVESPGTSKIALGEEGAERLLGKGHLAVRFPGEDQIILAQVPIVDADEIEAIVRAIREDWGSQ